MEGKITVFIVEDDEALAKELKSYLMRLWQKSLRGSAKNFRIADAYCIAGCESSLL